MSEVKLYLGDCLEIMAGMDADSVDSIVTDPPYGLEFMGKSWDHGVPGVPFWGAALRVAKPGAMLLAFGGTRTSHRLACAIEDAGWEIRDTVMWLYASGFPKSHAIGKAIDKAAGKEREVVAVVDRAGKEPGTYGAYADPSPVTVPATEAAALWEGWGTALAPSHEPIILAMKPRDGTFANNALTHGVAGLWIDGGRIPTGEPIDCHHGSGTNQVYGKFEKPYQRGSNDKQTQGRWPKNTIFSHHPDCVERGVRRVKGSALLPHHKKAASSFVATEHVDHEHPNHTDPDGLETVADWDCHPECPVRILNEGAGRSIPRPVKPENIGVSGDGNNKGLFGIGSKVQTGYYDKSANVSRFFKCFPPEVRFAYSGKASRKERNAGLEGMEEKGRTIGFKRCARCGKQKVNMPGSECQCEAPDWIDVADHSPRANAHPTVKPLAIMRYLCKLTKTPTGGIVLDPFMGSGTTGMAAIMEGRDFIGIEIDADYLEIAKRRIAWAQGEAQLQPRLGGI